MAMKSGVGKNAGPAKVRKGGKAITMGDKRTSYQGKRVGVAGKYTPADKGAHVIPQTSTKKRRMRK